ncbi:sulfatase [Flammeovirgaceae bacterium SG7u.111]|nr:sulfatase [Flammeovirgaceae bacterium SG7u.132]WPO38653.1 sulfatase [Flammeovirgaceae bacterium SG7u.111]
MKRFLVFVVIAFWSYISLLAQDQPNILWINGDDLGAELGCYGNKDVKTPNMDRLAKEGRRFAHAYANAPICSSSRSSMITGMYPTSINCLNHRTVDMRELPEGVQPITSYFQQAGYFCTNGKGGNLSKMGKKDFNFLGDDIFDGTDWTQRKDGQPFFAQVQIHFPHRTFARDEENPVNPDEVTFPSCYPDHPLLRADWAMYLESVQHCDKVVGMVLDKLEKEGLLENTIIFMFGDHGRPHLRDKQFLYEGGLRIPLIIRYPKSIEAGKVDEQLVSLVDVAATSLSLANIPVPSHLHGNVFMGEEAKEREYVFGFRQRAGDAVDDIRSITDGQYKLIWNRMPQNPWMQLSGYKKSQYPAFALYHHLYKEGKLGAPYNQIMAAVRPEIELYDLGKDPDEFDNLAGKAEYKKIQKKLFSTLKKKLKIYEKGMVPESPETIEKAQSSSRKYFENNMKRKGLSGASSDEEIVEYWEKILGVEQ